MTEQTASHKPDNLFGVCNALGEDFGFNPLWLRLALSVAFLFAPLVVISGYFAVGAAVLAARLIFPRPKSSPVAVDLAQTSAIAIVSSREIEEPVEFARAA